MVTLLSIGGVFRSGWVVSVFSPEPCESNQTHPILNRKHNETVQYCNALFETCTERQMMASFVGASAMSSDLRFSVAQSYKRLAIGRDDRLYEGSSMLER